MDRRYLLVCALALRCAQVHAQVHGTLNINDVEVRLFSNGRLGQDDTDAPAMIVPAGSGMSPLYAGGLWMFGQSVSGSLKGAAHLYGANGHDFFPGPLTADGMGSISPEVSQQFDHVWSILRSDVELHEAYLACQGDPDCIEALFPNGYTIPDEFLTWPGNGDVDAGQDLHIAPFIDLNGDDFYDPYDGDHPCVPGDQALFCVFNDKAGLHAESGSEPFGVEVQMLAFAYDTPDPALAQTVFVHYRIINRSSETLSHFRIGLFSDFDLGCPDDDLVGTDAQRGLIYAFNRDNMDADCAGTEGYGAQPPAFGMVVLQGPFLDPDTIDNAPTLAEGYTYGGMGFGDGIWNNERHGLSGSMHMLREGNVAMTEPGITTHFNNYLGQTWKDYTPLTYGGSGYSGDPNAQHALYAFPGTSDPLGLGTNGTTQPNWTEALSSTLFEDKRMVATLGEITLQPGDVNGVLVAYVYARADEGGPQASLDLLLEHTDAVRAFASQFPTNTTREGSTCESLALPVGMVDRAEPVATLDVFPVPATDRITVRTADLARGTPIQVIDVHGAVVLTGTVTGQYTSFAVAPLADGPYVVRATDGKRSYAARFVKED